MLTCLVAGVLVLQLGLHKTNCPFTRLLSSWTMFVELLRSPCDDNIPGSETRSKYIA